MRILKNLFVLTLLICGNSLCAQLQGSFVRSKDSHYYFVATNSTNTYGRIKITAVRYDNSMLNEEYRDINGYGDGFYLGPSTPWHWFWHNGDRIYVTYADGTCVYWECPYTDTSTSIAFKGKHCHGILGCDCPGFEPVQTGTIADKQYCRHCGHHKRVHN